MVAYSLLYWEQQMICWLLFLFSENCKWVYNFVHCFNQTHSSLAHNTLLIRFHTTVMWTLSHTCTIDALHQVRHLMIKTHCWRCMRPCCFMLVPVSTLTLLKHVGQMLWELIMCPLWQHNTAEMVTCFGPSSRIWPEINPAQIKPALD